MIGTPGSLGVIYLARAAEGVESLARFAASYALHEAGIEHDLIVLYKGHCSVDALERARGVFSGLDHIAVELDDTGFDIGSYVRAAEQLPHERLCFLNTHSEILAPGWLARLDAPFAREDVGLAGAMGSYESLANSVAIMERAIDFARSSRACPSPALTRYFDFLLAHFRPDWFGGAPLAGVPPIGWRGWLTAWAGQWTRRGPRGTALIWPGAPELDTRAFPAFPNPHIRSNAFLMSRMRLLRSDLTVMCTKADANLFESGRASLTSQIFASGLSAVVTGRDGATFSVAEWSGSGTFRLGTQANLLVGDNHTRAFAAMSEGGRAAHERMTWGDYLRPAPEDFPDFRVSFPVSPSLPLTNGAGSCPASLYPAFDRSFPAEQVSDLFP